MSTVTGFYRPTCADVCVCAFTGEPVCVHPWPLCINHLTQTYCWLWIYASMRGSWWQCICPSHNGWYTEHAVIWQICSVNGSQVGRRSAEMDGVQPRVEPSGPCSLPRCFGKHKVLPLVYGSSAPQSIRCMCRQIKTNAHCALSPARTVKIRKRNSMLWVRAVKMMHDFTCGEEQRNQTWTEIMLQRKTWTSEPVEMYSVRRLTLTPGVSKVWSMRPKEVLELLCIDFLTFNY